MIFASIHVVRGLNSYKKNLSSWAVPERRAVTLRQRAGMGPGLDGQRRPPVFRQVVPCTRLARFATSYDDFHNIIVL